MSTRSHVPSFAAGCHWPPQGLAKKCPARHHKWHLHLVCALKHQHIISMFNGNSWRWIINLHGPYLYINIHIYIANCETTRRPEGMRSSRRSLVSQPWLAGLVTLHTRLNQRCDGTIICLHCLQSATSPAKTWGENGGSFKCWGCHVSTFNMTQSWCQKKGHVAELFGGQILFGTGPNVHYQTNFGPLLSEVSNPETGTSLRQEDNDESENKGQQVWDAPVTTNNSQPSLEIAGSQAMQ